MPRARLLRKALWLGLALPALIAAHARPSLAQFPPGFPQSRSNGPPTIFIVFFVVIFVVIIFRIFAKLVSSGADWVDNSGQPVETIAARVVAKRVDVSGGQNSTRTQYFITFELPGGPRQEFNVDGSIYGQLAEGDHGQLTRQGSNFMSFNRTAPEEPPVPTPPALPAVARVCQYCGGAIAADTLKCPGCGWTWRPPLNRPVES